MTQQQTKKLEPSSHNSQIFIIILSVLGISALILICTMSFLGYKGYTNWNDSLHTKIAEVTSTSDFTQSLLAEAKTWEPDINDSFDTKEYGWWDGKEPEESEYGTSINYYADSSYMVESTAHMAFYRWMTPDYGAFDGDFYLAVEGRQISGPIDAEFGLIFRDARGRHYIFYVNGIGFYLAQLNYFDSWDTLASGSYKSVTNPLKIAYATLTPRPTPPEMTRLAVLVKGPHFYFFINDQFISEAEDDRILAGEVGIIISLNKQDDEAVFEFDNFELRRP